MGRAYLASRWPSTRTTREDTRSTNAAREDARPTGLVQGTPRVDSKTPGGWRVPSPGARSARELNEQKITAGLGGHTEFHFRHQGPAIPPTREGQSPGTRGDLSALAGFAAPARPG